MLILMMLVGLQARVCMHPYDGAAVETDCKQTNKHIQLPNKVVTDSYVQLTKKVVSDSYVQLPYKVVTDSYVQLPNKVGPPRP
jgi:hypothetical protein